MGGGHSHPSLVLAVTLVCSAFIAATASAATEEKLFLNNGEQTYHEDLELSQGIYGSQKNKPNPYEASLTVDGKLTINKTDDISGATSDSAIIIDGGLKANYLGKINADDIALINANNSGAVGIAMTNGMTTGDGQHSATLNINSNKDLTISGFARGILVNANNNLNINIGGKFDLMAGSISDNYRGINLGNKIHGKPEVKDIINFSLTANDDINITDYKSGFLVSVGGNLTSTVTSQNGSINIINNRNDGNAGIDISEFSSAFSSEVNFNAGQNFVIQNYDTGIKTEFKDLNIKLGQEFKIVDVNTGIYAEDSGTTVNISPLDENNLTNSVLIKAAEYGLDARSRSKINLSADRNSIISEGYGTYSYGLFTSISLSAVNANLIYGKDYSTYTSGTLAETLITSNQANNVLGIFEDENNEISYSNTAVFAASSGKTQLKALTGNQLYATETGISTESSGKVTLESTEGSNFIQANDDNELSQESFGNGLAIKAISRSSVTLNAAKENTLMGAVYVKDKNSAVSLGGIEGNSQTNTINSFAVIDNAGNLQADDSFAGKSVISALYAEGDGASITLTGDRNYLNTFANSGLDTQLERTVWAYSGAKIKLDGWTSISTGNYDISPNSLDVAVAAGTAVNLDEQQVIDNADPRSVVTINYKSSEGVGKSYISGDILAAYAGDIAIKTEDNKAGLDVRGNLLSGNKGSLSVDLGTGGTLTGRVDDYGDVGIVEGIDHSAVFDPAFSSDIYRGGNVSLTMGDNSKWLVTGQSWISNLEVKDGAQGVEIDLVEANTDRNQSAHALTIRNMKGNATFHMSLDGNRQLSDMLYMGKADGEYVINVVDPITVEDMYKDDFNGLRFATVGKGSNVSFTAVTLDQGIKNVEYKIATDAYENNAENDDYNGSTLDKNKPGSDLVDHLFGENQANDVTTAASGETKADSDIDKTTNFKIVGVKEEESGGGEDPSKPGGNTSDAGRTIINMSRANYANAVQLDTLNKRQGEMRFSQGREDGMWVRMRHDDIGKKQSFRLSNTMVELGYDWLDKADNSEYHTGVALDYMQGDTDYHNISGSGELDRIGVWAYRTWLGNDGDYTDMIFKYGHLANDFELFAKSTGEKISGDYDNHVLSVSLEHGKKFKNSESWFIEPQAQLQYSYVTSADYKTSQDSDVRLDAIHSLIGRLGVRAGKDLSTDDPFTIYARGDIMHEFLGDQDIYAKDKTGTLKVRYENDETWYSGGVGMTYMPSKDSIIYFEGEKIFGASNTSSYIVSGGIRVLFE